MGVALHLGCPFEKAPEIAALAPHELPKFHKTNLRHLHAGVGFDAPQQVGTSPRGQAMAFGGIPEKTEFVAHAAIIITNRPERTRRKRRRYLLDQVLIQVRSTSFRD